MARRRPAGRPRRPLSFVGKLQRCATASAVLGLALEQPTGSDAVLLLERLAALTPKGGGIEQRKEAKAIRSDAALSALLARTAGAADALDPTAVCDFLWSLAVLRRPLSPAEGSLTDLGALVEPAAPHLDLHTAAQAAWAWGSLERDSHCETTSPPEPLRARASELPFCVHLDGAGGAGEVRGAK